MKLLNLAAAAATTSVLGLTAFGISGASAAEFTLRMQTHYSPEQTSGKLATQFVDDVETMSGGRIDIELFYSSSVVKSVEGFDAAASGILDGEMHGGAYLTGKNPAFQFVGDIMGGYDTPWQQYAWLYHGGGYEAANELYNEYNMQLIGWWIFGQESLSSSTPIAGPEDLKDWKFRSPPGMETEIFANLGASPIVMDFAEVPTAMETGIIEGTDYSTIGNNVSIGLYDIVDHATYPGFHSMPSDHVTIRKDVWDSLPEDLKRIIDVATQKLSFQTALAGEAQSNKYAAELRAKGVNLHNWSDEDRATFRAAAQASWKVWGEKSPEAKALVESHVAFMKDLGLVK